jgi:hypothetical protein
MIRMGNITAMKPDCPPPLVATALQEFLQSFGWPQAQGPTRHARIARRLVRCPQGKRRRRALTEAAAMRAPIMTGADPGLARCLANACQRQDAAPDQLALQVR